MNQKIMMLRGELDKNKSNISYVQGRNREL